MMNPTLPVLTSTFARRLFLFLLLTFAGLLVATFAMGIITVGGQSTVRLRIATVIQDICVFIAPACMVASMVTSRPDRLLEVDRGFSPGMLIAAVSVMVVSIPAMNALVDWNAGLSLPASMGALESWMRSAEQSAGQAVMMMLGDTSPASLLISLLIVGVLAGVSEELFFRGALQRLLSSGPLGPHASIWIAAFVFSFFHMQFFGFFPRLVLGAFFGYLLYWSGSLWLPVTIHALNNAVVVIGSWQDRLAGGDGTAPELNSVGSGSPVWIIISCLLTAVALWWVSSCGGRGRKDCQTHV